MTAPDHVVAVHRRALRLCGSLGYLQYRWIGEVSLAARDRLRAALQVNLVRLSQDFNSEIANSCRALLPSTPIGECRETRSRKSRAASTRWKKDARAEASFPSHRAGPMPEEKARVLRILDQQRGAFERGGMADGMGNRSRQRIEVAASSGRPGQMGPGRRCQNDAGLTFRKSAVRPAPEGRGHAAVRPARNRLGGFRPESALCAGRDPAGGAAAAPGDRRRSGLSGRSGDPLVSAGAGVSIGPERAADHVERRRVDRTARPAASASSRTAGGARRRKGAAGAVRDRVAGVRTVAMFVRHRAGSLDAAVAQARWRNLAVTGGRPAACWS